MSRFSKFYTLNPNHKNRVLSRMNFRHGETEESSWKEKINKCTGRAGWHLHSNGIVSLGIRWIINRRHQALDPEEHHKLVGMVLVKVFWLNMNENLAGAPR